MKTCTHCQLDFVAPDWDCPKCGFVPCQIGGFTSLAPAIAGGGGGFPPEAFKELAALESANFWFRARNRLIMWSLKKYLPHLQRYLEIGCGTGYVLRGVAQAFPNAKLTGSEIFSVGLPFAATRVAQVELLQMDARYIPYVDEFDAIGAFDVLEHIEEDEQVLQSMWQALRPGGAIAISVPQHRWLWSASDIHACHVRRYQTSELRTKVQRAGFTVAFETSFVSLLLPAMLASRLCTQRTQGAKNVLSELRLPTWLNKTFEAVMGLERQLIQWGARLPVGGSRLLIATKSVN